MISSDAFNKERIGIMIKFGTGGWRAIIGEDFTRKNVQLLSQGFANTINNKFNTGEAIVIGYDRRFLSDKAAKWMAEVMAGNGIKVYFIPKISPTPLIMFAVLLTGSKYGAAITASHNPAEYNGIKIFTAGGKDANQAETTEIEKEIAIIDEGNINFIKFDDGIKEGIINFINPFNGYIDSILSNIDLKVIRESELKIILDPMYGVSKTSLQVILNTARCELDVIHDRHDTLFGGRLPSPNTATLQRLKQIVVEKGYDLGIGTDGDADRIGIIDKKGNFIHPNDILVLLYYYLLKFKKWEGDAVRNIATTHLLDKVAESFGYKCHEVPVGFKYISSKMEEEKALIGGESSGGLTISGHIRGKDGIFAASLLVEMICVTRKSLSEMMDEIHSQFGYYIMTERNFSYYKEQKDALKNLLFTEKLIPDFPYLIERINYMDGVKIYFKNGGWVIARFSGTEPLLRVFAEMESEEKAIEVTNIMKDFLKLKQVD